MFFFSSFFPSADCPRFLDVDWRLQSDVVTDSRLQARTLFSSATLVVGFHPDQATEPCVDLALANRVPFVVCPCCTFPAHFPDRRLPVYVVVDIVFRTISRAFPQLYATPHTPCDMLYEVLVPIGC